MARYIYASGNRKRMKSGILFAIGLIVPSVLAVSLRYWLGAPTLIRLFMENSEIVAYGTKFLRAMCLATAAVIMLIIIFKQSPDIETAK